MLGQNEYVRFYLFQCSSLAPNQVNFDHRVRLVAMALVIEFVVCQNVDGHHLQEEEVVEAAVTVIPV